MKLVRKRGDTSVILQIFIQDSSSTTGAGLTGLVFNSAGLTAYYHRDVDGAATVISLVTMTVGTFTSSGFKEIDATNMPGWYQLCPPDAAFSATSTPKSVGFHLKGATNMAPLPIECQLVAVDLEDAAAFGLSRIDAAVTTRLAPTVAGRTLDVAATGETGLDFDNIHDATGAHTLTNITVPVATAVTNDVGITQAGADKVWGSATRTLTAFSTALALSVWDVLLANITTATSIGKKLKDWTLGSDNRVLVSADVHTSGETVAAVTGAVGSVTGSVGSVVGAVGSVTAGVTVTTNNDKTGYGLSAAAIQAIWDALTAALTTVGSIGKLLVDNLNATISSRSTVTTAQVKTQVVDALATDTYAEPVQGAPAATTTLAVKVGFLYKFMRNKITQTSTTLNVFNDDAATVDHKATVSDDGTTFTRGEIASGP